MIAGVIGKDKFAYDIWGDAVNVAALMESHAVPGQILLSDNACNRIEDQFNTMFRDEIETSKKEGRIRCHVLLGQRTPTP